MGATGAATPSSAGFGDGPSAQLAPTGAASQAPYLSTPQDGGTGAADAGDAAPTDDEGAWRFSFTPYFWLFDIDGSIDNGRRTLPVSMHLHDAVDLVQEAFQFGLAGHLEATNGRWSIFLDGNFLEFEEDESASRSVLAGLGAVSADLDMNLQIAQAELGAAYRVADLDGPMRGSRMPIEILGGVRWNSLDVDADLDTSAVGPRRTFQRSFAADFDESWFDPFIGVRTDVPLGERLSLRVRGDIGGGVGDGSDFAWNAVLGLTWRINDCTELFAGYRWYDFERDDSGRDTDLQLEGPGLGVLMRF